MKIRQALEYLWACRTRIFTGVLVESPVTVKYIYMIYAAHTLCSYSQVYIYDICTPAIGDELIIVYN
jgi:hypothetical protein